MAAPLGEAAEEDLPLVRGRRRSPKARARAAYCGIGALLLLAAGFALFEALTNEYSGLQTAIRRARGSEIEFKGVSVQVTMTDEEYAEALRAFRTGSKERDISGDQRAPMSLCPVILALNQSSKPDPRPAVVSLSSFLKVSHMFTQPPVVIWKRGTTFDAIEDPQTEEALRIAAENRAFRTLLIEDSSSLKSSHIFSESLPETKEVSANRRAARSSEYYLAAMRLCLLKKCDLCALVEEGMMVSSDWPRRIKEANRTGGWEALVSYADTDSVSGFEGWAMEDLPLLMLLIITFSFILLGTMALIAFPDEQVYESICNDVFSIWTSCLLFCLISIALMGRSRFSQCAKSILEDETQRDDVGFYFNPSLLFNGVTVLRTEPLIKQMINPVTQALMHTLGHQDVTGLSIEAKVIVPVPNHPSREFVKWDVRVMIRTFIQIIRKARIFIAGT